MNSPFENAAMSADDFQQTSNNNIYKLTRGDTVDPKTVKWFWYPHIPAGQITLLGGKGGSCKGLIMASLAASYTRGRPWPDDSLPATSGHILWGETEDPLEEVLTPRMIAADADRARILYATPQGFTHMDLKRAIRDEKLGLIVLSPMLSFLAGLDDINGEMRVREALEKIQLAITGTTCAVVGICHCNKKPDLAAVERLLGSVAFVNFVRSVLLVAPDKDEQGTFRVVHAKHNLSVKGDDFLITPHHIGKNPKDQYVRVGWTRPENGNVDTDRLFDHKRGKGDDAKPSARDWLRNYLRAHGETERTDVLGAAAAAGFKGSAIDVAISRNPDLFATRREGFPARSSWGLR
jgi:hypothetical protein